MNMNLGKIRLILSIVPVYASLQLFQIRYGSFQKIRMIPSQIPKGMKVPGKKASMLPKISPTIAASLSFPCNITDKLAVSAINRATSKKCRQSIVNLACASQKEDFYPSSLESECQVNFDYEKMGNHKGCFRDNTKSRIMQKHVKVLKRNNSPSNCIQYCTDVGSSLAGMIYSGATRAYYILMNEFRMFKS